MRVLLVDDSERLRDVVRSVLEKENFVADTAASAAEFADLARSTRHDIYLVDLGLPDGDGLAIIKSLRAARIMTPILVITGQGHVQQRVDGLNAGADDYLVKPFHRDELLARMRALLRRPQMVRTMEINLGALHVNVTSGETRCVGRRLELTPTERRLLVLLLQRAGAPVPRSMIIDAIHERQSEITPNALDKLVSRLRQKLSEQPTGVRMRTVKGDGYMIEAVAS
jgi:DNA-binding response OmpR family regulator